MASQPYYGTMIPFAGTYAPKGWMLCQGQLLQINTNQALFSLLGTTFGGNGTTNFALPDMRGRGPIGSGGGPGLTFRNLGDRMGSENVTLTAAQLPAHTHQIRVIPSEGTATGLAGQLLAKASDGRNRWATPGAPSGLMANDAVSLGVSAAAHANTQPGLALNWIIATTGFYPPRP